jgi:hypothetical protein
LRYKVLLHTLGVSQLISTCCLSELNPHFPNPTTQFFPNSLNSFAFDSVDVQGMRRLAEDLHSGEEPEHSGSVMPVAFELSMLKRLAVRVDLTFDSDGSGSMRLWALGTELHREDGVVSKSAADNSIKTCVIIII